MALRWLKLNKISDVVVFTDNKSIPVRLQTLKEYRSVKNQELILKIKNELDEMENVHIRWISYRKNKKAHKLCKLAMLEETQQQV